MSRKLTNICNILRDKTWNYLCYFIACVCHAFASVHCCLVVTCCEKADLLALISDVYLCFVAFSCGKVCTYIFWLPLVTYLVNIQLTGK